ncbi:sarcoglycan delta [Oratosquilla oratoria]|uniref:sarcoglycan delta n=1 Tax=Oratosquilla oratoria TaxID=337810 RepID=UPI003F76F3C0
MALPVSAMEETVTIIKGVVQGYRPQVDWGGDSGSATIVVGGHNVRVATSGWRRRCLYILLIALLLLCFMNLALMLWILKGIQFNMSGMGQLQFLPGGVELDGWAHVRNKLSVAGLVHGRENTPLSFEADYNITLSRPGATTPHLVINNDGVIVTSNVFRVVDPSDGETSYFEVDAQGSRVGSELFTVTGAEGVRFQGSMQTPQLYSRNTHEFRLESQTRGLFIHSAKTTRIEARGGDITATSGSNAKITSHKGRIRLENPKVYFSRLREPFQDHPFQSSSSSSSSSSSFSSPNNEEDLTGATVSPVETQIPPPLDDDILPTPASNQMHVYQVCACPTGRLFLVAADAICKPDRESCR